MNKVRVSKSMISKNLKLYKPYIKYGDQYMRYKLVLGLITYYNHTIQTDIGYVITKKQIVNMIYKEMNGLEAK